MASFRDDQANLRKDFEAHKRDRAQQLRAKVAKAPAKAAPVVTPAAEQVIRQLRKDLAAKQAIIEKIRADTVGMRARSNRMSSVPNNVLRDFCTDILRAIEGKK